MGNKLCCSVSQNKMDNSPMFNSSRFTEQRKELRHAEFLSVLRKNSEASNRNPKKKKDKQSLKFIEAFSLTIGHEPIKFLSFS
jgi:hypothetical protein